MTWPHTPVFLPGEFHSQRSLAGYSPWGHKESDTNEWLTHSLHFLIFYIYYWYCIQLLSIMCSVSSVQSLSHVQLCNPKDCSMPGLTVHHQLWEFTQTPSSRWCNPTISSSVVPFSSCLQSFPTSGSFPMSHFFTSGGQSIGVSASTSILPMNI